MKTRVRAAFLALLVAAVTAGCAGVASVSVPPPAAKVEVRSTAPGPDYVWVSGHWKWNGSRYVWVDGYWQKAKKGSVWVDGHWKKTPKGHVWVKGHWR